MNPSAPGAQSTLNASSPLPSGHGVDQNLATGTRVSPPLSAHFAHRAPSPIRIASIRFAQRRDGTDAINVAIGNVSLPMHPAMIARLHELDAPESPFSAGVVRYTSTVGEDETRRAFLNIIASSGLGTDGLHVQVTDGGSQAMELMLCGCCGPTQTTPSPDGATAPSRPLMLIDAAYTNYTAFAQRLGRTTVSITRTLNDDGRFSLPSPQEIDLAMSRHQPGALVVIPYDNPTGHYYDRDTMRQLARLCVRHNCWMVSDEAYRELYYGEGPPTSIWSLTEQEVPGLTGRRIRIESASKVWNACGLRIGALVTDSEAFHAAAVAENTAGLCSRAIGQYVFGAIARVDHASLASWYGQQRAYYRGMLDSFTSEMQQLLPGVIASRPEAAIYSTIDVRRLVDEKFDAMDFVMYCATTGSVDLEGRRLTLLTSPMSGFYNVPDGAPNPGRTQMRVAYVESPERMRLVPRLFADLFRSYQAASHNANGRGS